MIASPDQTATRDKEGTADEVSSPDIIFKDIQSATSKPKSKSRNDASTTKTSAA
jgi:hypothetical protein